MEATLASIVASASPLVYAAIGETIAEKAGVVNLSLEGSIRLSAMTGFAVAFVTGNPLIGFLAAMAVGMTIAAIVAFASIELRLNQIAVGFVLTLLAIELSSFLGDPYVGQPGRQVPSLPIPLLSDLPFLGKVLFDHNLSVYGSYLAIAGSYLFIFRTRRGLEMQGVGDRPEAAFARGIPVNRLRYLYTIAGGALAGIAGAAFSLDQKLGWSEGRTSNFGWIALAIVIFGGWHPFRVAFGAYLFGVLQWAALKLQPVFPSESQILSLLPFALMIFALVLVYLRRFRELSDRHPALRRFLASDPPSALGTAFHRE
ncbi:MAG: ABC transporter permease [Actinobacteria bacterium]|nr:ABC transporter permease [Actinomycetota bacterium]